MLEEITNLLLRRFDIRAWLPGFYLYPSRLGCSLLLLGSAFYLVAMHTQSGLLLLLLGAIFGCFVLNLIGVGQTLWNLRISDCPECTAEEQQLSQQTWQLCNDGKHAHGPAECFCRWGRLLSVPELAPQAQISRTLHLRLDQRGIYTFKYVWLRSSAPFALLHAVRRLPVSSRFIVLPASRNCPAPAAAGFRPVFGGSLRGSQRSAYGSEISGTRPLQPGDSSKRIHWPASAKGLGLQVREFHEELAGGTILLIDPGLADPAAATARARLDSLCRLAASLLAAAQAAGNQIETVLLDSGEVMTLSPFVDPRPVLISLAGLQVQSLSTVEAALHAVGSQLPPRAALCWLVAEAPGPRPQWPVAAELLARPRTIWYCPAELELPATLPRLRYGNCGELVP